MCIQVENIGMRTAQIEGFGWTTGYANVWRFLPKALRLRSVHQLPDYEWAINKNFPWTLEPGESQSTFMRREEFIAGMAEHHDHGLFRTSPIRRRPFLLHHRVYVTVATLRRMCRSEEHTSELQSLMRISYAVFCLKKKQKK